MSDERHLITKEIHLIIKKHKSNINDVRQYFNLSTVNHYVKMVQFL